MRVSWLECYLEFSGAFGSTNHRPFLIKFESLIIWRHGHRWVETSLNRKTFHFRIMDNRSFRYDAMSGVSQKSVSRALLFLLFIENLVSGLCHVALPV